MKITEKLIRENLKITQQTRISASFRLGAVSMDLDKVLSNMPGESPADYQERNNLIVTKWEGLKINIQRNNSRVYTFLNDMSELVKFISFLIWFCDTENVEKYFIERPPANPVEKFLANVEEDIKGIGRDIRRKK